MAKRGLGKGLGAFFGEDVYKRQVHSRGKILTRKN